MIAKLIASRGKFGEVGWSASPVGCPVRNANVWFVDVSWRRHVVSYEGTACGVIENNSALREEAVKARGSDPEKL